MDTLSEFGKRIELLDCGKWFIPKFIEFQYGRLSEDCKAHRPIFMSLQKHHIKGYPKGIHTLQEKEKEKDKETEQEERGKNRKRYATFDEVKTYGLNQPFPVTEECCEMFFDRMEEIGWMDDKGLPLADWRARFRRYATNWINNRNGRKAS